MTHSLSSETLNSRVSVLQIRTRWLKKDFYLSVSTFHSHTCGSTYSWHNIVLSIKVPTLTFCILTWTRAVRNLLLADFSHIQCRRVVCHWFAMFSVILFFKLPKVSLWSDYFKLRRLSNIMILLLPRHISVWVVFRGIILILPRSKY